MFSFGFSLLGLACRQRSGSGAPPIDPPTVLTAPTITLDGYTATITLGAFSGADSTAHELLVDGVSVGPISAGTLDVSEYAGSTLVVRSTGTNAAGSTSSDSDPAVIFVIQSQFGMNQTSISYFRGNRPYVNMAKQEPWRVSSGGVVGYEADVTKVDRNGDIIAMRAGATYTKYMGRSGPNTSYKYRATWTGPGAIGNVFGASAATVSGKTSVSPNVYEWTVTYDPDPEVMGWFSITFNNTAAANPVIGLDVREIDDVGNYIEPDAKFHAPWLALQAKRGVLRFMDWLNINGDGTSFNTSSWTPMDWADRTPVACLSPGKYNTPAKVAIGTGTSALTFTANEGINHSGITGYQQSTMNALVSTGMKTNVGAEGNNITVQGLAASGAGSVAVNYAAGKINIVVTPAAATADGYAAAINASVDARTWINVVSGGAGAVAPFGPIALSGGAFAQNPAGFPVEDLVEICNLTNCDLHYQLQPRASDDFVTNALTYIRDNLNPTLKVYVELSNEVWNQSIAYRQQMIWFAALGVYANGAPGGTTYYQPNYGYAYRYRQIMVIAENVFSTARDRLQRTSTAINAFAGSTAADLTGYLKAPADGGNANLYIGNHMDEVVTAPYWGDNVFDPVNARMKGAWSNGMTLVQFDYAYYAANSTLYFATAAHTSNFASPDLDPQLLPLTAANLEPFMLASMDRTLNQAKGAVADVVKTYVNDLGNPIRYGSYEGGPSISIGDPGGAGSAITKAAITAFYTDPLLAKWEGIFLSEYRARFGSDAIFRIFAATNGPWGFNFNFAIQTADWSLDAVAPRAVGFRNALENKFPTYWWLSGPTIAGLLYSGSVLTVNTDTLHNAEMPAFQWTRDGTPISGATDSTYTQVNADIGHIINVTVTGTGALNSATASSTNATATQARTVLLVLTTTGPGTFTLPADWPGTGTVAIQGAGGAGAISTADNGYRNSGGSGGYTEFTLTGSPGDVISYSLPAGGVFGGASPADATFGPDGGAHSGGNATNVSGGAGTAAAAWTGGSPTLAYAGTAGSTADKYTGGAGGPGAPGPLGLGGAGAIGAVSWGSGGGGADGGAPGSLGATPSTTSVGGAAGANGGTGGNSARTTGSVSAQQGTNGGGSGGGGYKANGGSNADFIHGADATFEELFTSTVDGAKVGPGGGPGSAGDHFPTTNSAFGRGGNGKYGSGGAGGCVAGYGKGGDAWAVLSYQP